MCSKLNEGQQYLFNFIMKYANEIWLAEKNDKSHTESYNKFLSGGTGVKKNVLVNFVTEYLQRNLRCPGQTLSKPSVLVIVWTGKAATGLIVQHCILHLFYLWKLENCIGLQETKRWSTLFNEKKI